MTLARRPHSLAEYYFDVKARDVPQPLWINPVFGVLDRDLSPCRNLRNYIIGDVV